MALQDEALQRLSLQAKEEIGEVNITEKLESLKNALAVDNYEDLRLPPNFDDFLLSSLRSRKFEVARAAKLVSQYFKLLREMPDMQYCFIPSLYQDLYNTLGVAVLKHRDAEGRVVVLTRQELVHPSVYTFEESLSGTILILEEALRSSVDTQRLGISIVCDWKGFSFAHLRQMTPSRLRFAAKLMQDSFPIRLKAIHFIRNPALVSGFYMIAKPFLQQKIRDRIHFHGHDFNSIQDHMSPDIMPKFLGGNLPNDDYADLDLTSRLIKRDIYYKELFKHGYTPREENLDKNRNLKVKG